jgi:hypothetical protein
MKALLITDSKDRSMWYSKYIGRYVPLLDEEQIEYKSLEPAGYINFVLKKDCEVKEVSEKVKFY